MPVRQIRGRKQIYRYLSKYKRDLGCADCGTKNRKRGLQFHHIDPKNKKFDIGTAAFQRMNFCDILLEVTKCEVLCDVCHKHRHGRLKNTGSR